jgi:hypothetical protein
MEIDIRVKGGIELSKFYPDEYEKFEEKIGDLIIEMFPGVDGFFMGKELTDRHKAEEEKREQIREKEFKETLIRVLESPEGREILRARVGALAGN